MKFVKLCMLQDIINNRRPYWIGSTVWGQCKTLLTFVFHAPNFQHCFLALELVLVIENSSNNPRIMVNKLFRGERKLPKAVLFVWRTSVSKILAHVCRSSWSNMVSFRRCLSINNTTCTGMWFMVNCLWFTKSVISPSLYQPFALVKLLPKYITTPIMNSINLLFRSSVFSTEY